MNLSWAIANKEERIEAKNGLENYCPIMLDTLQNEKLEEKSKKGKPAKKDPDVLDDF